MQCGRQHRGRRVTCSPSPMPHGACKWKCLKEICHRSHPAPRCALLSTSKMTLTVTLRQGRYSLARAGSWSAARASAHSRCCRWRVDQLRATYHSAADWCSSSRWHGACHRSKPRMRSLQACRMMCKAGSLWHTCSSRCATGCALPPNPQCSRSDRLYHCHAASEHDVEPA